MLGGLSSHSTTTYTQYDAALEAMLLAVLKWCHKEMTSTKKEASHRERGRLIRCILRKFGRQTNSLTPIEKLKPKRQGKRLRKFWINSLGLKVGIINFIDHHQNTLLESSIIKNTTTLLYQIERCKMQFRQKNESEIVH